MPTEETETGLLEVVEDFQLTRFPALNIEAKGEVITSNAGEFRNYVRLALAGLNRSLLTDEDFGQAEENVKGLKKAEAAVTGAKEKALQDAVSLHALFAELDETTDEIRKARLDLESQITKRKDEVKAELVREYLALYDVDSSVAEKHFLRGLQLALKGKRTVKSMREALNTEQVTKQGMVNKSRTVLDSFEKAHGKELVLDRRDLEVMRPDQVEAELRRRFDLRKAEEEKAELAKIAADAKAEMEKAKRDLAEVNAPPAPPAPTAVSGSASVSSPPPTEEAADWVAVEWETFKAACMATFKALRPAREAMKHPANMAKGQALADAINAAWKEVTR